MNDSTAGWMWLVGLFALLLVTLIPILIASKRRVLNIWPTVIVSVLLSWSCLGFFIALLVATASRTQGQVEAQAAALARAIEDQR